LQKVFPRTRGGVPLHEFPPKNFVMSSPHAGSFLNPSNTRSAINFPG
jgi:hypothetical protein